MSMPSDGSEKPSVFDRFADTVNTFTSKAWFFAACAALIVVWAPSILILPSVDTWQLAVNTPTTVITFLLVALIQNTQKRTDDAMQEKLNALSAYFLNPDDADCEHELRAAIGLEDREGS